MGTKISRTTTGAKLLTETHFYQTKEFSSGDDASAQIRLVFWMDGNFVVAVARDKTTNSFCLKLFTFESEKPVDCLQILKADFDVKIELAKSKLRQYVVLVLQEIKRKDQSLVC